MVKGKLARNRRKRRTNYPLEKKIQILSIKDLKSEDIRSKLNAGYLIVLKDLEGKPMIYELSKDGKIICLAYKIGSKIKLFPHIIDKSYEREIRDKYVFIPEKYIDEEYPLYHKLNPKLEIINQN